MERSRTFVDRRLRWTASFVALLVAVCAAPVFGADATSSLDPSTSLLPSAEDRLKALEEAEGKEEERKAWLASPEAIAEREESRFAYADLDSAASRDLLSTVFAEVLAQINQDPARFLSDAKLVSVGDGETSATVKDGGNGLVMDSSLPVRTEDEEGDLRKVDLSLEESPDGYETENALVDVAIPNLAEKPIEVGEEGVSIKLAGVQEERPLQPLGDENVLASEVLTDTDMLVSPVATGVEIFNLLRSEYSPETFRFQVGMPAGAHLRDDGGWGIEVVKGDEVLAMIPEPIAMDAQGTDVPVDVQIEGDSMRLTVDHREGDYAMPILLDPAILENGANWIYGQNHHILDMGIWIPDPFHGLRTGTYCFPGSECFGPQGTATRGLIVSAEGQRWYGAGEFGHWNYNAPANSYISSVTLGAPYVRDDKQNCQGKPGPYDYFGVWNGGTWGALATGSANYPGGHYTLPGPGQAVEFGLGTAGGGYFLACHRDLYAGGAHIWLDDNNWPSIQWVDDPPTHWINGKTSFDVIAQLSDAGLGIQNAIITMQGGTDFKDITSNQCTGTRVHPCLTGHTAMWTLDGKVVDQGRTVQMLSANDPTGKYTNTHHFELKVDRSAPIVTLNGQLAIETNEVGSQEKPPGEGDDLRLPIYHLDISATDGVQNGTDSQIRSGVKDIEIYLDGKEQLVPWEPNPSPCQSCPMTKTYKLNLIGLDTAGDHTLKVKVIDQVGNYEDRYIEFEYFPATGMKDEYVTHYFPLPDGQGNEAEEERPVRPELAVNVMNGNLTYREQDIEIKGPAVNLEVERFYNSQLPDAENSDLGDGWTLGQTPDLAVADTGGSPAPDVGRLLESSGAFQRGLALPTETGATEFNPALRARLTKRDTGGFRMTDETGESATSVVFDETGQTEALVTDGLARVDYSYEGGGLSEIAVVDPGSAAYPDGEPPASMMPSQPPVYAVSIGSAGTGNGQFNHPGDVAIAPDGDLWVADAANNRIQHFDSNGNYISKFGSTGTGNGQFKKPVAVEVDEDGFIWVLDSENERIQKFNDKGEYLTKWGSLGTATGKLDTPKGFAIDPDGNFWISDTNNQRVQKFSETGTFLKVTGTTGPGDLTEPMGIAVGPNGEVFVADWAQNRVVVFNAAGEYQDAFGSEGEGDGQFRHPSAVEIDSQGHVWVSDDSNERVERFDLLGNYVDQFGSEGSGNGQMELNNPVGIATDSKGGIWLTDAINNRVQLWIIDDYRPAYEDSFGSSGSGNGQLGHPADVAIAPDGDIWVADMDNDRVQHFDSEGNFISKFGTNGTGNGQFRRPAAIEVDDNGYIWVLDPMNQRMQKFNDKGEYLAKWGTYGASNGKLHTPESFAIDSAGNFWVSDVVNARIQKFTDTGTFLKIAGTSGPGDLSEPLGLDIGPNGDVFVTDWAQNRVVVFDGAGEYQNAFGTEGTGSGQFRHPAGVEVDSQGNVWVMDESNERVEQFDLNGEYITQFGVEGSDDGEMDPLAPMGITTDAEGSIWLADSGNDRIQKWALPQPLIELPADEELLADDPVVQVEVDNGLLASIEGEEAGEHSYEHEGDFLVSHDGPEGETLYEKDGAGRLTKVTLANGTWGKIEYHPDGRVSDVTVDPAGEPPAKKTEFEYIDLPHRQTEVIPSDAPALTYEIGEDGSVFKWWHKLEPPKIKEIAGSLYFFKGKEAQAGAQTLSAEARSDHGIQSIQFIANGNQLVDEARCEQTSEPGLECLTPLENEWLTETSALTPGILQLEVIATDRFGQSASERFWVEIPDTPPPTLGGADVPKVSDILKFREEHGLEIVFPVADESELNNRILDSINDWLNPGTPAGQVARASWERWGVPLRAIDVAELEYRLRYQDQASEAIPPAASGASSTYAGFYADERAGGLIRIGFTQNQASQVAALRDSAGLMAPDRVAEFVSTPAHSIVQLEALDAQVSSLIDGNPNLPITSLAIDIAANRLSVGASNVAEITSFLASHLSPGAPVAIHYATVADNYPAPQAKPGRERIFGPVRAGDRFSSDEHWEGYYCTAGFGAWEKGTKPSNGQSVLRYFMTTAGHCAFDNERIRRRDHPEPNSSTQVLGHTARRGYDGSPSSFDTDASAVRLEGGDPRSLTPRHIYVPEKPAIAVRGVVEPRLGMIVCHSGVTSDSSKRCGEITRLAVRINYDGQKMLQVAYDTVVDPGDSGSPVWQQGTGNAVGIATAGAENANEEPIPPGFFTPLLPVTGRPNLPGVFGDPEIAPLHIFTVD